MNFDKIYEQRINDMKMLVEKDMFNTEIFADYYCVPTHTVRTMFRHTFPDKDIDKCQSEDPLTLQELNFYRDNYIVKSLKSRQNMDETLESIGYWFNPIGYNYTNKEQLFKDKINDLVELYYNNRGHRPFQYITGLSNTITFSYDHAIREQVKLKYNHKSKLKETNTSFDYKREERRQKIYEMYSKHGMNDGMTQEEIAAKLGITRATVMSDLKKHFHYHPELIDKNQLYRPRHQGSEKFAKKQKTTEEILKAYDSGMSASKIYEELEVTYSQIRLALIENGRIEGKIDKEDKKLIKESQKHPGNFTEKVKYQDTEYNHYGATPFILDKLNSPLPKEKGNDRTLLRAKILNRQRENMAVLRSREKANQMEMEIET